MMRSLSRINSFNSEAITITDFPPAANSRMSLWTSTFEAISTPCVGSSKIKILGFVFKHRDIITFCWFPPLRLRIFSRELGVLIENLEINNSTRKKIEKLPDNTELYVRVYDPIKHNNSYKLPEGYKAPICTSLGQKPLIQPIFTESKLLFQGTDLETAYTQTQVGSIMPKFIYKEYKDVKIN